MTTAIDTPTTASVGRTDTATQQPLATINLTDGNIRPQPARRMHRTRLTFDQFLLGQLPLVVAVALTFGAIAYAAAANMPVGTVPSGGGAAAGATQSGGAASDAPITAFSGEAVAQQLPVAVDQSGGAEMGPDDLRGPGGGCHLRRHQQEQQHP
jgi:hypothetical protein